MKNRLMKMQMKTVLLICCVNVLGIYVVFTWVPHTWSQSNVSSHTSSNSSTPREPEILDYDLHWRPDSHKFLKRVKGVDRRKEGVNVDVSDPGIDGPECDGGPGVPGKETFTKIGEDIFVFSAFYDDRMNQPFIRMIAAYKNRQDRTLFNRMNCLFEINIKGGHSKFMSTNVTFYEMCENHRKSYGGWILSCAVPEEAGVPVSVRIYEGARYAVTLVPSTEICIISAARNIETRPLDFGLCVPPMFGSLKPKNLIEFIEFNRLLGVEKFLLYIEASDTPISTSALKILKYYESLKVVHLIQWALPFDHQSIWYHGQSLAINDCLYRHMKRFHHLAFTDLDEFIVPKNGVHSWSDMFEHLKADIGDKFTRAGAFVFKTAYFSPEFSRHVFSNEVGSVVRANRTLHYSYRRHKVIVRPGRIFELGIHHVSRAWPDEEHYSTVMVPKETAFIHHYRACVQEFGIRCNSRTQDFTVANIYGTQLENNILKVMSDIVP